MKRRNRPGIILLVVLSMLTFFSLLVATYLVFSSQAQQSSIAIGTRNIKQPDPNLLLNEALMTIVRGTNDATHPFFGEDLLSDFYGRSDAMSLTTSAAGASIGTSGFAKIQVTSMSAPALDDVFAGRLMTFREGTTITGPAVNRTYRVIRSISLGTNLHDLIVELEPDVSASDIGINTEVWLNGVPRNSPGIGFDGTEIADFGTAIPSYAQVNPASGPSPIGQLDLAAALQPNHLGGVSKSVLLASGSDFDESYDAADFNNWFLSYRFDETGDVIPSFHRPSVLNYIINKHSDWPSQTDVEYLHLLTSVARGTFRPIPIAEDQLATTSDPINERFTGGSSNFALRTPLLLRAGSQARLHQLVRALIQGPWDVDNDSDGIPDSIWIDLDLPIITSPEGKLIKPLVAPMIEDLSARLNVNANHNTELDPTAAGVETNDALWAGSRYNYNATTGLPLNRVFRGLGYGPAEIAMPDTDLAALVTSRYQSSPDGSAISPPPGNDIADQLDVLRTGYRSPFHSATSGHGYSSDPYGRGGIGIGRSGQIIAAESGTAITADDVSTIGIMEAVDESVNDPYEMDPTGALGGDAPFTLDDLEAILRSKEFDRNLLPARLRTQLNALLLANPEIARSITTISSSDDSPSVFGTDPSIPSAFNTFRNRLAAVPDTLVDELIAPEFRLGKKLDVNRPFGNGVDDNTNGVIDEPIEIATETEAFAAAPSSNQTVPVPFVGNSPSYEFGETVTGRELFARHLYVLMMSLTSGYDFPVVDTTMASAKVTQYRARRIAQWAVNVVDYRDPDAIMTRFVFDPTPFDAGGWTPDGTVPENIVWGVEAPELLFSEALALHDVRVKDIAEDNGTGEDKSGADPHTDQVRLPQGSLFLELYCPRSSSSYDVSTSTPSDQQTKQGVPQELYSTDTNGVSTLNLAATAPGGIPVWRIAISQPHPDVTSTLLTNAVPLPIAIVTEDPETLRTTLPDSASFEPGLSDELDSAAASVALDRFIWFQHFSGLATDIATEIKPLTDLVVDMVGDETDVFFAPSTLNPGGYSLSPGQYLAIAPRVTTNLGSEVFTTPPVKPSDHRFQVAASEGVVQYRYDGSPGGLRTTPTLSNASPAVFPVAKPMIVGTLPPSGWAVNIFDDEFVGLNVSEPMPRSGSYYPQPTLRYGGVVNANYPRIDSYIDYDAGGSTARDIPFDVDPALFSLNRIPESALTADEPFLGTIPRYCSAFLQRLADPSQAYDSVTNPYRTVDWIPIDLSVFSGEERPASVVTAATSYARRSRQRDGDVDGTPQNALFSYSTNDPDDAPAAVVVGTNYFSFAADQPLYNSLSFLNTAVAAINPSSGSFTGYTASIGNEGAPTVVGTERGLPYAPFAIHPWLNRPFASPYELMLVPACSQGRLFEEFTVVPLGTPQEIFPTDGTSHPVFNASYRHLMNFFHSDRTAGDAAEMARLFDFVHTLPPFRGEVEMISPSRVTAPELAPMLSAPFSFVYDNQRQGRVNVNTMAEFAVWKGLMQGHLNTNEFLLKAGVPNETQMAFDTFMATRRGFSPVAETLVTGAGPYNYDDARLNPLYPTQFAGIFRDAMTTSFMPALRDSTASSKIRRRPVNGTLLRASGTLDTNDPDLGGSATVGPQFVRADTEIPTWDYSTAPGTNPHLDRNRNAFMRYQTLMRMPNLVADNSQVFLVRLTLGFFEVDSENVNNLGAEYNESIGENQRYQAMFIVDRSIPVGFVPGQDLNARDTVIFERFYQ